MDLDRIIQELQAERNRLDHAIEALERLAPVSGAARRGKATDHRASRDDETPKAGDEASGRASESA